MNPIAKAKIEVQDLKLEWVLKNVEVLYPSKEQFEVAELKGIVLWNDKKTNTIKNISSMKVTTEFLLVISTNSQKPSGNSFYRQTCEDGLRFSYKTLAVFNDIDIAP